MRREEQGAGSGQKSEKWKLKILWRNASAFRGSELVAARLVFFGSCMFNPMIEQAEGRAKGGFREWAIRLVGGSRLGRDCLPGPRGLGRNHWDAATTGRRCGAGTGRPIWVMRLDFATKPWAPVPDLVKLEPLTEP